MMNDTFQNYYALIPDDKKPMFRQMHDLITCLFPQANIKVSYGILMYKVNHNWVGLGCWKGGISIYTSVPSVIAEFRLKHPQIKTGKGCINLRLNEFVPENDLVTVINQVIELI